MYMYLVNIAMLDNIFINILENLRGDCRAPPLCMKPCTGFHTGFFAGGGSSNCKGSASVRKHGHTRVSVRAT